MNFPHQFHVSSSISVLQGLGTIVQTILQSIPGKFWVTYFEIKYYDSTSRVIILVILVKKSSFVADNISNSFLHWPFIVTSGILLPSFLDLNRFLEADLGFCAGGVNLQGKNDGANVLFCKKFWRTAWNQENFESLLGDACQKCSSRSATTFNFIVLFFMEILNLCRYG